MSQTRASVHKTIVAFIRCRQTDFTYVYTVHIRLFLPVSPSILSALSLCASLSFCLSLSFFLHLLLAVLILSVDLLD